MRRIVRTTLLSPVRLVRLFLRFLTSLLRLALRFLRVIFGDIFGVIAWPFRQRGIARERIILFTVVFVGIISAFIAYPDFWNRPAAVAAPRYDALVAKLPDSLGKTMLERFSPGTFPERLVGRDVKTFSLGLDIVGGAHLEYAADTSKLTQGDTGEALSALRETIERRVNIFGVREPIVQLAESGGEHRLIVELAGITDVKEAIKKVGDPIFLEFREERPPEEIPTTGPTGEPLELSPEQLQNPNFLFKPTNLTGQYLTRSDVVFDSTTNAPQVQLTFNDEGAKLFEEITKRNIQKRLAIYIDGVPITAPVVQQEISGGTAVITGSYTLEEARVLSRNLNAGALPIPISLIGQRTVGATLGAASLREMLYAGIATMVLVAVFMIVLYRLPGILALVALTLYTVFMLALFKLVPVTLTLSGIAGFILSIGMAVDANILIFARMREERRAGRAPTAVVDDGFKRAWLAIRDSNVSTLLTTVILYTVGTSFVQGFALSLGVGVLVSMFSAVTISRYLLREAARHPFLTRFRFLW